MGAFRYPMTLHIESALARVVAGMAEVFDPLFSAGDSLIVTQCFALLGLCVVATASCVAGPAVAIGWPGAQHFVAQRALWALQQRVEGEATTTIFGQAFSGDVGAQVGKGDAALAF
ncbi:hypothetical protein D3C79_738190 [compost metagenome]